MTKNYWKLVKKCLLVLLWSSLVFGCSSASAERIIPVPESTLKQLLAESNLQEQILLQLEKNNAMQQTELAALKYELKTSKNKLMAAETLSHNAEKALTEANAQFAIYSKQMTAENKALKRKVRISKLQVNLLCVCIIGVSAVSAKKALHNLK